MIGAFISIFPSQLKAQQGWKLSSLLPKALLNVQIMTLLFLFTVQKYFFLSSWQQSACWVFSCVRNPPNSDLTWTAGSLTCVRGHSYACVYTQGLGTPPSSQHIVLYSEQLSFLCPWRGVRTSSLWISSPTLYQQSYIGLDVAYESRALKLRRTWICKLLHCWEHSPIPMSAAFMYLSLSSHLVAHPSSSYPSLKTRPSLKSRLSFHQSLH